MKSVHDWWTSITAFRHSSYQSSDPISQFSSRFYCLSLPCTSLAGDPIGCPSPQLLYCGWKRGYNFICQLVDTSDNEYEVRVSDRIDAVSLTRLCDHCCRCNSSLTMDLVLPRQPLPLTLSSRYTDSEGNLVVLHIQTDRVPGYRVLHSAQEGFPADLPSRVPPLDDVPLLVGGCALRPRRLCSQWSDGQLLRPRHHVLLLRTHGHGTEGPATTLVEEVLDHPTAGEEPSFLLQGCHRVCLMIASRFVCSLITIPTPRASHGLFACR